MIIIHKMCDNNIIPYLTCGVDPFTTPFLYFLSSFCMFVSGANLSVVVWRHWTYLNDVSENYSHQNFRIWMTPMIIIVIEILANNQYLYQAVFKRQTKIQWGKTWIAKAYIVTVWINDQWIFVRRMNLLN